MPYRQSTSDKGPRKDGRWGPKAGESFAPPPVSKNFRTCDWWSKGPPTVQSRNSKFSAATTPPSPPQQHLPFTGGLNSSFRLGPPIPLIRHWWWVWYITFWYKKAKELRGSQSLSKLFQKLWYKKNKPTVLLSYTGVIRLSFHIMNLNTLTMVWKQLVCLFISYSLAFHPTATE